MPIIKYDALYINDYRRKNTIRADLELQFLRRDLKLEILNYEKRDEKRGNIEFYFQQLKRCRKVITASDMFETKDRIKLLLYAASIEMPIILLYTFDPLPYDMYRVIINYDPQEGLTLIKKEVVI